MNKQPFIPNENYKTLFDEECCPKPCEIKCEEEVCKEEEEFEPFNPCDFDWSDIYPQYKPMRFLPKDHKLNLLFEKMKIINKSKPNNKLIRSLIYLTKP